MHFVPFIPFISNLSSKTSRMLIAHLNLFTAGKLGSPWGRIQSKNLRKEKFKWNIFLGAYLCGNLNRVCQDPKILGK